MGTTGTACLADEDLVALLEDRLPPPRRAEVDQHVASCAACRSLVSAARAARSTPTVAATPSQEGFVVDPDAPGAQPALDPGVLALERYRILNPVGAGGMGAVYAAHDETLDRRVALKLLRPHASSTPVADLKARLQREARIMARLSHPNVLPVFDLGTVDDHVFVAMELVDGWTLRKWLALAPRSWREILDVYLAAGDGLAAAHEAGLIHRDFKPDNVLIGRDGRVRVSDFGLAKSPGDEAAPTERSPEAADTRVDSLTRTGALLGTPRYMSPEQLRGEPLDARSDLFSYCASLYEAVAGVPPFEGHATDALLRAIQAGAIRPVLADPPPPRWLIKQIVRGLAPRPDDRLPSMRALLAELRAGTRRIARRRRALVLGPAAFALVAVGAVGLAQIGRAPAPAAVERSATRRAYAVLAPRNATGRADLDWLAQAFAELVGNELALGDHLRRIDADQLARTIRDPALFAAGQPGRAELARLRAALDVDLAVVGSFAADGGELRLELRLDDLRTGATLASIREAGSAGDPWALAQRAGARLRRAAGLPEVTTVEEVQVRSALPKSPEAARLYASALVQLRAYEPNQARPLLERMLRIEPDYAPANVAMAQVWRTLGQIDKAREASERAFHTSADLPRPQRLRIEARYHRDANRWREAADIYRALLTFFPDEIDDGLALVSTQTSSGDLVGALATCDRLRQLPSPLRDDPRIDLSDATAAMRMHDATRALTVSERAVAKARARGARFLEAESEDQAAEALHFLGRDPEALTRYQRAEALYREAGHSEAQARIEQARAGILIDSGHTAEGIAALEAVLPIFTARGDDYRVAGIQNLLGQVFAATTEVERAHVAYRAAIDLYRKVADDEGVANTTFNDADLLLSEGRNEEAEPGYRLAMSIYERLAIKPYEAAAWDRLATVQWRRGDLAGALAGSERAVTALRALDDPSSLASALLDRAAILRDHADPSARELYDQGAQELEKMGAAPYAAGARVRRVELLADVDGAAGVDEDQLRKDLELLRASDMPGDAAVTARVLARVLLAHGKLAEAAELLAAAKPPFRPDQLDQAIVQGQLASARGEHGPALAQLTATCAEAEQRRLYPTVLDCRLALGEAMLAAGGGQAARGRALLSTLAADAQKAGFLRVAQAAKRRLGRTR